ncbi:hypothetical protein JFK97_19170 [Chromobacterium phragmitis]|uniref:hypothetical protein n=1 Tax=Chromobacterium amazonense TaxID=1382803 RepID=UPI0021B7AEBB|nr:hypothetical protein [Chromobacterium amazonense]MBM2886515.1 hypothetical protein [Chromobacterium amazonense]
MEIHEFAQQATPRGKRSKMDPFASQILELKAKGYANWQIAEFLKSNDVVVTTEGVRKWLIKNSDGQHHLPVAQSEKSVGTSESTTADKEKSGNEGKIKIGDFVVEKPKSFEHDPNADKDKLF